MRLDCRKIWMKTPVSANEPPLEQQVVALSQEIDHLRDILAGYSTVRRAGRPEGEAWERAEAILALIKALNAALPPQDQWAITQSLLSGRLGLHRGTMKRLYADRQAEIEAINQSLPLPPHRQNFGHDFDGLRQQLEARLKEQQAKQQQSVLASGLLQQFIALLERSQTETQIRDPLAAALLRQLREAKGYSQRGLGQALEQPQSVIAALENGKRTLTRKMLQRYAQWLRL